MDAGNMAPAAGTSSIGETGDAPSIPDVLFHATPMHRWDRIRHEGLVASAASHPGRTPGVYLTHDESVARNYVEMGFGENGVVDWVVLRIDATTLDASRFVADVGQEMQTSFDEGDHPGFTIQDVYEARIPWWVSLQSCGQLVYEGSIEPSSIDMHLEMPAPARTPTPR
jgi:hypothetical protein